MDIRPQFALDYSIDELQKLCAALGPLNYKMNEDITQNLTIEERMMLRNRLAELFWHADQLRRANENLKAEKDAKFWKRFRK